MKDSLFWRTTALLVVIGLFYVGHGLDESDDSKPMFESTAAAAGVGVATENSETVFTSSADGKTIYAWQYFSGKPPKYLGKREAVLSE